MSEQEGLAMHGQLGPTVLRVDGAVSELEAAIDWAAIARAWPSAPGPSFGEESKFSVQFKCLARNISLGKTT